MTNIAAASLKHYRLHKGFSIDYVHNSKKLECINAHCWVITDDGKKILLQKRAQTEKCFSGLLDISFAGHVDEGENARDTIIREIYEEGHIKIDKYLPKKAKKVFFTEKCSFAGIPYTHNQQAYVYYAVLNKVIISHITPDKCEVGGFKLVKISDFVEMVQNNDARLVPHPKSYYKNVIKDILAIKEVILDLRKNSVLSELGLDESRSILSGGGVAEATLTTEELILAGQNKSDVARILRKSSTKATS